MESKEETFVFQAEINQLLSLIINTFYSQKEVFLRELVSNASDALDKIRHVSLTDAAVLSANPELEIRISSDSEAGTLSIEDSGIGMTREDLIKNLGMIAHSGTKQFMEALAKSGGDTNSASAASSLIGQFGMGFYSAFLVADKVAVVSKHGDSDLAYVWESCAGGTFTVAAASEQQAAGLARGTRIVLFLKEDQREYLEGQRIKAVLSRHSEFIGYPIKLKTVAEAEVGGGGDDEAEAGDDEDGKIEPEGEKTKVEWQVVNDNKPLWMHKATELTDEQYAQFYKRTFGDWDSHLAVKHFLAEGQVVFTGLLYIPKHVPFDMFDRSKKSNNLRLYVRRVFITDDCQDTFVPEWLGFVKGVVDSEDLPLNISREMLQQSRVTSVIKKGVVKKCIEMITDLAGDRPEDYPKFWEAFGKNIKWGITEDRAHQSKLVELLRFKTSKSGDEFASLKQYIERMPEHQKRIYYVTGDNEASLDKSAFTEVLKNKGYEVIYMTDPMDEYMMQSLKEYQDKQFCCASKDGALVEESESDEGAWKAKEEEHAEFCKKVKEMLGTKGVMEVKVSRRIVRSPCVVVTDQYGWTANMERIMRAQALKSSSPFSQNRSNKILELNVDHPIVKEIKHRVEAEGVGCAGVKDLVSLLFDTALLNSGFALDDPGTFADRMHRIIAVNIGIEDDADSEGVIDKEEGGEECTGTGVGTGLEELD
jgi:molecular chaperone HtpG